MSRKYGRTPHLPNSRGRGADVLGLTDLRAFEMAQRVIVTEKMDGENTTIHAGGCHARSLDSGAHPARDWMRGFAAGIAPQLGAEERIVGECLFARHSVAYDALPAWFLGFALIEDGVFADWDRAFARMAELGILPVPVLYDGPFDADLPARLAADLNPDRQEGFVLRVAHAFPEGEMGRHLAKYVRKGHVPPDAQHWSKGPIVRNGLAP
ncbi:MAG: RNA ligase family protein [Pseudomonadota bacterium]